MPHYVTTYTSLVVDCACPILLDCFSLAVIRKLGVLFGTEVSRTCDLVFIVLRNLLVQFVPSGEEVLL